MSKYEQILQVFRLCMCLSLDITSAQAMCLSLENVQIKQAVLSAQANLKLITAKINNFTGVVIV